jgi:anaerobic magnesium-protoporphyrin IX monomethyl ester cyclase
MRIALISAYSRPFAIGLRYVSSCLKAAGHDTFMVFMNSAEVAAKADRPSGMMEELLARLDGCNLVGLSLMTNSFRQACAMTRGLRGAGFTAPIIWGGVHPTLQPEECLDHADAVCIGEGEQPMLDLAERLENGDDPTAIPGLWFRAGGGFGNSRPVHNPVGPLTTSLDDLPFPDYELETHWVAEEGRLRPADAGRLRGALHRFTLITSRGCPYQCAFCNNSALRAAHGDPSRWVRLRSLDRVLEEMRYAVDCFPTIREFHIVDDLFFLQDAAAIEGFVDRYNSGPALPLLFQVSPLTVTERKVQAIARAPLKVVIMGIQSGSRDTLYNVFARPTTPDRIAQAIDLLAKYRLPTEYHYIVNNPYESEANVVETLRFVASHHRPAKIIRTFPLMFFPGTPLSERAKADGLIDGSHQLAYEHRSTHAGREIRRDYMTMLMRIVLGLRNAGVPSRVVHAFLDIALRPNVRRVLGSRYVAACGFAAYWVLRRGIRDLVLQPLAKLSRHFKKSPRPARPNPPVKWTVPRKTVRARTQAAC